MILILFIQYVVAQINIDILLNSLNFKVNDIAQSLYTKNLEITDLNAQNFKKYLFILETIDDLFEQEEKLLLFNQANVEYLLKKTKKNYSDQIAIIIQQIETNSEQFLRVKKNMEENQQQESQIIQNIQMLVSTIQDTLKENFSLNFHRAMPVLTQKITSGFFDAFKDIKTLDFQLLSRELERYQQFGQQVKESKKKELAQCYSLIVSVLKQAQILIIQEFYQKNLDMHSKLSLLKEDNQQLQQQLTQLKRIKRLIDDSQEFKQILISQYEEGLKLVFANKNKFRKSAKQFIDMNENRNTYKYDSKQISIHYFSWRNRCLHIISNRIYYQISKSNLESNQFNNQAISNLLTGQLYFGIRIAQYVILFALIIIGLQQQELIKLDNLSLESLYDKTSREYLEEKSDLYRNERNLYLCFGAFFSTLANIQYLSHIKAYYEKQNKVEVLEKKIKNK
ncbi:hypothetical protein pb186bvf_015394 [Paramecium bursaria]